MYKFLINILSTILVINMFPLNITKVYKNNGSTEIDSINKNGLIVVIDNYENSYNYLYDLIKSYNFTSISKIFEGEDDIFYINSIEADLIFEKLQNIDKILSVEYDKISTFNLINDPVITDVYNNYAFNMLRVEDAWAFETGNSTIKVGIVDTGIDYNHPDLSGRVSRNLSRVFSDGIDLADREPTDLVGHGTFVAGIIGAIPNNNIGMAGICKNIDLVSLKICDENGNANLCNLISAINYANNNDIPILNVSMGFYSYNSALKNAIDSYFGIVVCSAGNEGYNNDGDIVNYPASFDSNNIISVGATTATNSLCEFSNFGRYSVDICAPGMNICSLNSTDINSTSYLTHNSGTSFSAPFVTGAIALLLSHNENLSSSQIKNIILDHADKYSFLEFACLSGGVINILKSIHAIDTNHICQYTYYNETMHKTSCRYCDYEVFSPHNWVLNSNGFNDINPMYIPNYICTYCNATSKLPLL